MIRVHLYGNLRKLVENSKADENTVMEIESKERESFEELINRIGLDLEQLGDCFINGRLARTDDLISDGDRVGLFPFNMVLLCGGQHLKGHGYTKSEHDVDYY